MEGLSHLLWLCNCSGRWHWFGLQQEGEMGHKCFRPVSELSTISFSCCSPLHTQHLPLYISTEDWLLEGQAEEREGTLQAFHEHPQFAEGVDPAELKVILACHRPYCDCVPLHSKNSGKVLEASTTSRWFQERQSTYCLAGDFNRRVNLDC